MKTLVIGLGNPILTDDGVGIYAARGVRRALTPDINVDVRELAVGGLALMEAMIDYDRVILLDAIWASNGNEGQVMQFAAGDLPPTLNTASAHDVDLPTALRVGRELGAPLPVDDHIEIVAVGARHVLDFGETPTPPVLAAIPQVITNVFKMIGYPLLPDSPALLEPFIGGYDDFS